MIPTQKRIRNSEYSSIIPKPTRTRISPIPNDFLKRLTTIKMTDNTNGAIRLYRLGFIRKIRQQRTRNIWTIFFETAIYILS